jgi:hypothetical protein
MMGRSVSRSGAGECVSGRRGGEDSEGECERERRELAGWRKESNLENER